MTNNQIEIVPFNNIQGIASENVPAYSNEYDDFISFEGYYLHGIFTGFKWQCVEYARRWLLLRKTCIFANVHSAAHMWNELTYVERVTDGRQFPIKTYPNGCSHKPTCDSFLIYPRGEEIPFGHIAIICEVGEDFIRVAEQNYRFHSWSGNYAREIPLIKRTDGYYIDDYYPVYGWMEIEDANHELKPLTNELILKKYQQSKPIGFLERCSDSYYQANEDFLLNLSSTSNELYRLISQGIENIISNDDLLKGFQIPKKFWMKIRQSWRKERHFDIIDHLDFRFDGKKLKLCQYRRDNVLRLLQSAAIDDEERIEKMKMNYDFTSSFQLHRLLTRNFKRLNINSTLHILIDDNKQDDMMIALYMKKVMIEAGIHVKICLFPDDLYWKDQHIIDKDGEEVKIVWKLWDWERIFQDYDLHPNLNDILFNEHIQILEPIWKSIINHSAFLPVLFTMFPDHPNIFQNEWFSKEESTQIPDINWSMDMHNDGNDSDHMIVSWMIDGVFSGFSIPHEQNQITYCCVI